MNRSLRRAHVLLIPLLAGTSLVAGAVAYSVRPERAGLNGGFSPALDSLAAPQIPVAGERIAAGTSDGLELVIERASPGTHLRVTASATFALADCLIYAFESDPNADTKRDRFDRARLLGTVRPNSEQVFAMRDGETAAFAYGLVERATVLEVEISSGEEKR